MHQAARPFAQKGSTKSRPGGITPAAASCSTHAQQCRRFRRKWNAQLWLGAAAPSLVDISAARHWRRHPPGVGSQMILPAFNCMPVW
jgi:hypothetical protein